MLPASRRATGDAQAPLVARSSILPDGEIKKDMSGTTGFCVLHDCDAMGLGLFIGAIVLGLVLWAILR
jgi:hypothetical protein